MNKHNMTITIEVDTNKAQKKYDAEQRLLGKLYDTAHAGLERLGTFDADLYNELYETLCHILAFYNNQSDKVVFSNKSEQGSILYILAVLPIFCFMLLFVWLLLGMINHDPNAIMVLGWLKWVFGG